MTTSQLTAAQQTALDHLADGCSARLDDATCTYYDHGTQQWYRAPIADLDLLAALLDDDREDVRRDAYSHWCSQTTHDEISDPDAA